jgi:hypothetical protein
VKKQFTIPTHQLVVVAVDMINDENFLIKKTAYRMLLMIVINENEEEIALCHFEHTHKREVLCETTT